ELVMVIGRRCRHVPADRAAEVVGGYLVGNDVSARDWQRRSPTVTLGKSFDATAPTGPWVTTADDVEDPHDLRIRTWVNGEQVQDGRTADMITDCWAQIALLSSVFTLEPGDLISTGTPAGAAQQSADPRWLRPGDRVSVAVDGLGLIDNEVVAAPETTVIDPHRRWPPSGPTAQGGSR
ncbi:MAG TPA: fumarylacetoacetate hydrolase family protein, partial [Microthrixaceae bacterium]|nr:fumarylacetoacetate hydrolase family protein [Microthrixaceae bacterium]